jgi:hypothetical protein
MMNVEVFDPLPNMLFESLVPFSQGRLGKRWGDVYRTIDYLSSKFPGTSFRQEPYFYLDLKGKRPGLLFVEHHSERLYFVYENSKGGRT